MKKITRKLMFISLVLLMIMSQTNLVGYAMMTQTNATTENETETVTENTEEEAVVEEEEVTEPEVIEELPQAETLELPQQPQLPTKVEEEEQEKIALPNADENTARIAPYKAGFLIFDGKDITTNKVFEYRGDDLYSTARTLSVNAHFPTDTATTNRKVEIQLNNLLQIKNAPGMVADTDNLWKFDASQLTTQLQGVVINATFIPAEKIAGKNTGAGKIIYEFSPGTESAILDFSVYLNPTYGLTESATSSSLNPIIVTATYYQAGTEIISDTETIEEIKLQARTGIHSRWLIGNFSRFQKPGEMGTLKLVGSGYLNTAANGNELALIKASTYVLKIDKRIELLGIKETVGIGSAEITAIDSTSDSDYNFVTVELKEYTNGGASQITFDYKIPDDAQDAAAFIPMQITSAFPAEITTVDDKIFETKEQILGAPSAKITIVATAHDVLSTDKYGGPPTLSFTESQKMETNLLGGFRLFSKSPDAISNQTVQLDFSQAASTVGVTLVVIPQITDVQVQNIEVLSTKGNKYQLQSTGATSISAKDLGILDEDEYIENMSWDYVGTIPPNWNSTSLTLPFNSVNNIPVKYFGKLLQVPASKEYKATISVVQTEKGLTDPSAEKTTEVIRITEPDKFTYASSSNLNTTKVSGTTFEARASFNFYNYKYSDYSPLRVKGFNVYLRETEYLSINEAKISTTWKGKTYSVSDGTLLVTTTVDNTGSKVYKLSLPDVTLGYGNDKAILFPGFVVNYEIKIKNSAPTISINTSDLAQIEASDTNILAYGSGSAFAYQGKNTFDVTGSGNTNQPLGVLPSTQAFNIQAQKDFSVTTAANLNNGPWVSYDYDSNSSIIDLNPSGDAKYQLTVANNSGTTINGYTALVPIPKAGEKTDLTPASPSDFDASVHIQKEAFNWTASLLNPVTPTGSLSYQVLYATTYETDKDSANFKPWNAITNKEDIRMVKIVTNDDITDGFSEAIDFKLSLTDPNADTNAGKINIYSARVYRSIMGTAGYKPSEPIAIRLRTGVIKGQAFDDSNRNGLKEATEKGRNGVSVLAYEAGTTNLIETTTTQKINGIDGSYEFLGLDKNQKVDIVFMNPNTNGSTRFSPVTTGGSTATATADYSKATTSDLTPSATQFDQVHVGIITPITMTFNAGKGSTAQQTVKKYPGETLTDEPDAVLTGHTLKGWYDQATNGTKVTFPYAVGTKDMTLYAQYTVNDYTLTLDNEGATTTETVTFDTLATEPTAPTKEGYTFTGWYDAVTAGNKWDFASNKMPAKDVTLYAQYTVNDYTLTLDNEGVTTAQTVTFDTLATEPTAPTKEGYTFTGWYDAATAGNKWDFANNKMPAKDVTLYAQYTVNDYTLTLDNEGVTTVQTVTFDTLATEPTAPTKEGYTFIGWYDAATAGNKWDFSSNKMPAKDVTLYAQYTVNHYTITFNNQGTMTTESGAFDQLLTAPTEPTKPGYHFTGWKEMVSGKLWNFAVDKVPASDITLISQFEADNQTITFNVNGGDEASKPADIVAPTDSKIDLNGLIATKPGYQFIGWFDSDTQVSGTTTMPVGGLALTAHWTAENQVVHFDTNGGTGVSSIVAPTDSTIDLAAQMTTRAGYTFKGWYDADDTLVTGNYLVPAGGMTLTAKWHADDQTITFDINGGDTATKPADMIAPTDTMIQLSEVEDPTRFGFKFAGWFDEQGNKMSDSFAMPADGLALKAEWIDLIATGVWKIEAENIEMTVDEFLALQEDGDLNQEILTRSHAKAWDDETNEVLTPLAVNIGNFENQAVKGSYPVTISYSLPSKRTRAEETEEQVSQLVTEIQLTLTQTEETTAVEDATVNPTADDAAETKKTDDQALPMTGSKNQQNSLVIGMTLIVAGIGFFLYERKKKTTR
ncbi:InlB B-repeat-containing protein [Isobaculum melis]|uniref:LPXTG-motif cell wall anchor domain-containing protein/Listeria/Bacterioides repeat-containing protein n=1 Tax=Isobaculum melis TaxID=142588 RepID=A0A1H9QIS1_9LACT|nr:InlB B-repeat-containing protein [Isobaculum melis]SER60085.1 LPXTG-motif cell wall anchor domain-containing protein/Listeria/Bacterioides repeat-containing protein [Isobaculum melis]